MVRSILRFGIPQGTEAQARVPWKLKPDGVRIEPKRQNTEPDSFALKKAKATERRVSRRILPYPSLRDLGL